MSSLYIYAFDERDLTLSYYADWRDAFRRAGFTTVNLWRASSADLAFIAARAFWRCPLIVLGHSCFYRIEKQTRYRLAQILSRLSARKAFFLENEYRLFKEKINFAIQADATALLSQFPQDVAEKFYRPHVGERLIVSVPHALNPAVFKPGSPPHERPIDLGSRFFDYPYYLGDRDRFDCMKIGQALQDEGFGVNLSTDPGQRFSRHDWADFLVNCRATVSSEAGSSFIEYDDQTRLAVNAYQAEHPQADFDEVYNRFFRNYPRQQISGKIVSPRHFEAAGTKTCQILLPGRYNDILLPSEHYFPAAKDLSNLDAVKDFMRDRSAQSQMVERAYEHVAAKHTHDHRVATLMSCLGAT